MKRTSLSRKTPMKRSTAKGASRGARAGRTTRGTKSRGSRVRDESHLVAVRRLGCVMVHLLECRGIIEAHHAGRRGVGQKCSDYDTHGFCSLHHLHWHAGIGPFKGWTRQQRREWADEQILLTRERLGR